MEKLPIILNKNNRKSGVIECLHDFELPHINSKGSLIDTLWYDPFKDFQSLGINKIKFLDENKNHIQPKFILEKGIHYTFFIRDEFFVTNSNNIEPEISFELPTGYFRHTGHHFLNK